MDIFEQDTFDIVLSRIQRTHNSIISLLNQQEILLFKSSEEIRNRFPDIIFVSHYYPRKIGVLPVYNFQAGANRLQFFGSVRIADLLPPDFVTMENLPILPDYSVCIEQNGFCVEKLLHDHYVIVKNIPPLELPKLNPTESSPA